jgi:hypothetical protein
VSLLRDMSLAVLLAVTPCPVGLAAPGGAGEAGINSAHTIKDVRCTQARNSRGRLARSRQVLRDFQRLYGRCPKGWDLSHSVPLMCCGEDSVENLSCIPHASHVEFHADLQRCSDAWPSP